jgi:hypothetical protein
MSGKFYPTHILIDGQRVPLQIARFTVDDNFAFMRGWTRLNQIRQREQLRVKRAKEGEEAAEDTLARLSLEETAEARAAREKQEAADDAFASAFVKETFAKYISLPAGAHTGEDGNPIESGLDFLAEYAARDSVIRAALAQVFIQNKYPAGLKKKLNSLFDSAPSSDAPSPTANGDAPVPTADSVSNSASVESEAVTA